MSIAKKVEDWLSRRAYIRYCLSKGLINRSALARKIAEDLELKGEAKFDAIHMAIRRFEEKIGPETPQAEKVLEKSRLEVRTGMGVAIGKESPEKIFEIARKAYLANEEFHLLQEPGVWTVIAPMHIIEEIKDIAFKVHEGVVELVVKSPPAIENTPGVLAEISERLTQAGINIIEFLSCWTDSIMIVKKEDMQKAIEALKI